MENSISQGDSKYNLWRPETTVRYCRRLGAGLPGRRLVECQLFVKILGERIAVKSELRTLEEFSRASVPSPNRLRRRLGDHFFLRPEIVMFAEFRGDPALLRPISTLPTITEAAVVDSPHVGDEAIDIFFRSADFQVYRCTVRP